MQLVLFILAVPFIGIVGVVGIYLKFAAVLVSLLLSCVKLTAQSLMLRALPSDASGSRLSAKKS